MATPRSITRGLNADWTLSVPDYPATDGWVVEYTIVNANEQHIFSSALVNGAHAVTIDASTTGGYGAGEYFYQAVAKKGANAYPVETGNLQVNPNFSELTNGYDARPHVKKVLDAIEALLEGKATSDQASYQIGSRKLERYPIPDLLVLRDKYRAEWKSLQRAEKLRQGIGGKNVVLVRF